MPGPAPAPSFVPPAPLLPVAPPPLPVAPPPLSATAKAQHLGLLAGTLCGGIGGTALLGQGVAAGWWDGGAAGLVGLGLWLCCAFGGLLAVLPAVTELSTARALWHAHAAAPYLHAAHYTALHTGQAAYATHYYHARPTAPPEPEPAIHHWQDEARARATIVDAESRPAPPRGVVTDPLPAPMAPYRGPQVEATTQRLPRREYTPVMRAVIDVYQARGECSQRRCQQAGISRTDWQHAVAELGAGGILLPPERRGLTCRLDPDLHYPANSGAALHRRIAARLAAWD
jgi:hypothetical protein